MAALIEALKSFEGGVLIITHNREFSESVCSEVWAMRDGHLTASGHNWVEGQGSGPRLENKEADEETFDAMGNKIENKKKKKVTVRLLPLHGGISKSSLTIGVAYVVEGRAKAEERAHGSKACGAPIG